MTGYITEITSVIDGFDSKESAAPVKWLSPMGWPRRLL